MQTSEQRLEALQESVTRFLKLTGWDKFKGSVKTVKLEMKDEAAAPCHCGTNNFENLEHALEVSVNGLQT